MRAQELQTSTLIMIILAILILALVLYFVIIPIATTGAPKAPSTNVTAFEFDCQNYCAAASNPTPSTTEFCTATMPGTSLHCYDMVPQTNQYFYQNGQCTYTDSYGHTQVADSSTC